MRDQSADSPAHRRAEVKGFRSPGAIAWAEGLRGWGQGAKGAGVGLEEARAASPSMRRTDKLRIRIRRLLAGKRVEEWETALKSLQLSWHSPLTLRSLRLLLTINPPPPGIAPWEDQEVLEVWESLKSFVPADRSRSTSTTPKPSPMKSKAKSSSVKSSPKTSREIQEVRTSVLLGFLEKHSLLNSVAPASHPSSASKKLDGVLRQSPVNSPIGKKNQKGAKTYSTRVAGTLGAEKIKELAVEIESSTSEPSTPRRTPVKIPAATTQPVTPELNGHQLAEKGRSLTPQPPTPQPPPPRAWGSNPGSPQPLNPSPKTRMMRERYLRSAGNTPVCTTPQPSRPNTAVARSLDLGKGAESRVLAAKLSQLQRNDESRLADDERREAKRIRQEAEAREKAAMELVNQHRSLLVQAEEELRTLTNQLHKSQAKLNKAERKEGKKVEMNHQIASASTSHIQELQRKVRMAENRNKEQQAEAKKLRADAKALKAKLRSSESGTRQLEETLSGALRDSQQKLTELAKALKKEKAQKRSTVNSPQVTEVETFKNRSTNGSVQPSHSSKCQRTSYGDVQIGTEIKAPSPSIALQASSSGPQRPSLPAEMLSRMSKSPNPTHSRPKGKLSAPESLNSSASKSLTFGPGEEKFKAFLSNLRSRVISANEASINSRSTKV